MWKDFKRKIQQERKDQGEKPLAKRTFHQIRNALNMCLRTAEDKEWIDKVPEFREPRGSNKVTAGRAWFEPKEQTRLLKALDENIEELEKTRHHQSAGTKGLCAIHAIQWATCWRKSKRRIQGRGYCFHQD